MNEKKKTSLWDILLYVIIAFYIYFIIKNILFKYLTPVEIFSQGRYFSRTLNLIPFKDLFDGVVNQLDIFGNIILFIPFGLFLKILYPKNTLYKNTLIMFFVSLSFEILQFILAIGASDITDIIYNVIGGIIGIILYKLLKLIFKKEDIVNKIIIILGFILMILVTILLIALFIYN